MGSRRNRKGKTGRKVLYLGLVLVILAASAAAAYYLSQGQSKPIILYVDQGNGAVNRTNFGSMLSFASMKGFNTVFFQVYRQGVLLFDTSDLSTFVNESHADNLKIFFSFYITNSSQGVPGLVLGLKEDGISLDMSTLSLADQQNELAALQQAYHGTTAVTTTDLESALKPDLLVLETYGASAQQYVRHGTIASVGVFATTSKEDYDSQFQYDLKNSDGVMVFDYAGLAKSGY
jgi:hypothetical protein